MSKNKETFVMPSANVEENDVLSDVRYICNSCTLITESLQKGCDVLQMPNGDIIVSELKRVTFQYSWDSKRGKLVRVQAGNRPKKPRNSDSSDSAKLDDSEDFDEFDEELEQVA